jgi:sugar transferase (PEP-CTERM/EpsH1 system associated)
VSEKPLIAHVLYRLDTGGMERMLITLINHTLQRYRHAIICLEGYGALRASLASDDVQCIVLAKKPGKDWHCYARMWRVLRALQPAIVHTYNFGALDMAPVAKLAGVRRVLHAERGRDAADPNGESRKYRRMRRWLLPFIDRYVTVSADLQRWLIRDVHVPSARVTWIPNGIDVAPFGEGRSMRSGRRLLDSFAPAGSALIGTVGRLDAVKDQLGLIEAFCCLRQQLPQWRDRLRLVLVGEGAQRKALEAKITSAGLASYVQLLGNRTDVAALLGEFDIFALSSIAEGMPGALLEAMAAGLPVVATRVGGVGEVVVDGVTGTLVEPGNPAALAQALRGYVEDESRRAEHGCAGRQHVEQRFSLPAMLAAYTSLYDGMLARRDHASPSRASIGFAGRRER